MPKDREWLTEKEIRGLVLEENKEVHEEMREAFTKQNSMLEKQNVILDRIADGAQAQILSATILHGNSGLGLKGVLPDILERVTSLEISAVTQAATSKDDRKLVLELHGRNECRLDKLEENQNRIFRSLLKFIRWSTTTPEGGVDYKKVVSIGSAIGVIMHFLLTYFSWFNIKMFIVRALSMLK